MGRGRGYAGGIGWALVALIALGSTGAWAEPASDGARGVLTLTATKTDDVIGDMDFDMQADPGDTLLYTVTLTNPLGAASLTNVFFGDVPDANTALLVGSVMTSQGVVTSGNSMGDTGVQVLVGSMADNTTVTITFQVLIDDPVPFLVSEVSNQGSVASSELPTIPTDDPDTGAANDATVTPLDVPPLPVGGVAAWIALMALIGAFAARRIGATARP